eukprot:sb/3477158/
MSLNMPSNLKKASKELKVLERLLQLCDNSITRYLGHVTADWLSANQGPIPAIHTVSRVANLNRTMTLSSKFSNSSSFCSLFPVLSLPSMNLAISSAGLFGRLLMNSSNAF